jgi:hypothetical protein
MKKVDDTYGPLDWRMPETHAIYWAMLGLEKAKKEELITLRRVIYQSMQLAFQRGRYIENKADGELEAMAPNLDIIPNANRAYQDMMEQDAEMRDHIQTGHRNFLKQAVYFLFLHNRVADAAKWFAYVKQRYPEAIPAEQSLDEYAIAQVTTDVGETSHTRVRAALDGLLINSFYNLAMGEDAQAVGYHNLALKVWQSFQEKVEVSKNRVGLPPFNRIKEEVQERVLDPEQGILSPLLVAQLRTALRLPPPANAPPPPPVAPKTEGSSK